MNTLVIYDETGYILSQRSGEPSPREPVGVPFLWVEITEGKYVESVDVSVTPHQAILVDVPPTENELLNVRIKQQEDALFELAELLGEVFE